jgi:hypothetical protein
MALVRTNSGTYAPTAVIAAEILLICNLLKSLVLMKNHQKTLKNAPKILFFVQK